MSLTNIGYLASVLVGGGGIQFLAMRRWQKRELVASATGHDVQAASVVQQMALDMLAHKDKEVKELQDVIRALVAYIQSVPELPDMPPAVLMTVKEWGANG